MPNLGTLIERKFPEAHTNLLRRVGEMAESGDSGATDAYLVGGPVRDLILGRQYTDLDLVVVGDGPEFASALADTEKISYSGTSEFQTAKLIAFGTTIDVATARTEIYSEPGALPKIESSGIKEDLCRRDFSVNAMAVALTAKNWGHLLDNHGGLGDVMSRRLRILHDASFRDDPTRILRALRYEAKLGFQIEDKTLSFIDRDVHWLRSLSPKRTLTELYAMLDQRQRSVILARADDLGVLASIDPALRVSKSVLDAMGEGIHIDSDQAMALITFALTPSDADCLVQRLSPTANLAKIMTSGPRLRQIMPVLDQRDLKNSEIVSTLVQFPEATLLAAKILCPRTLGHKRLCDYLNRLRLIAPECTGDDLLEEGVPQGPLVGLLLNELQQARLDGTVLSRRDELELVAKRMPILTERVGMPDIT